MYLKSECSDVIINSRSINSIEIVDNGLNPGAIKGEYRRFYVVARLGHFGTGITLFKSKDKPSAEQYLKNILDTLNRKES